MFAKCGLNKVRSNPNSSVSRQSGRPLAAPLLYTQPGTLFPHSIARNHLVKTFVFILITAFFSSPSLLSMQLRSAATTPEDRTKALHGLFHDYWEAVLKHKPEFASVIGDSRYNDQVSDYSVAAINQWLATEQEYLMKLAAIDPTGLADQDKISRDLLLRDLAEDEESAEFQRMGDAGQPDGWHPLRVSPNRSAAQLQHDEGLR